MPDVVPTSMLIFVFTFLFLHVKTLSECISFQVLH